LKRDFQGFKTKIVHFSLVDFLMNFYLDGFEFELADKSNDFFPTKAVTGSVNFPNFDVLHLFKMATAYAYRNA
jgi:hypothetical protein